MTDADLQTLTRRAQFARREVDALQGEMRSTLLRGKELQTEVKELVALSADLDRVSLLLNSMGEQRQEQTQQRIEELVTRGLQTIFDSSLSFHISQSTRGKAATVEFLMRTTLDGHVVETPVLEARGGGVAVTIGFLLRLVVLLLRSGADKESLIVLDETFSMVSADYLPAVGEFLREIVDKTGVQILMVTHQDELTELADRVYRFKTVDGKTQVAENG